MLARLIALCLAQGLVLALFVLRSSGAEEASHAPSGGGAAVLGVPKPAEVVEPPPSPPPPREHAPPIERAEAATQWREDDPLGVVCTGFVRTRDGEACEALLYFVKEPIRRYASSNATGQYAVVGLTPGVWSVHVRGSGIATTDQDVTITDAARQHVDFTVGRTFAISVVVTTPEGEHPEVASVRAGLDLAKLTVAGQSEPFPQQLAPTDYGMVFAGDAVWEPERNRRDVVAGQLFLRELPANVALLQRHVVLQQRRVQPGDSELRFEVSVDQLRAITGTAVARVLDAQTGAPIPEARVALHTSNRGGGGGAVDEQGRITIEGLTPGLMWLHLAAKGYESVSRLVRIDAGGTHDLGDLSLDPALPLQGTVLGPDGEPVASNVFWTQLDWHTPGTEFVRNLSTRATADGRFSIRTVGRGPIALAARGGDGEIAMLLVDHPQPEPIVLRLEAPGVCVVRHPGGAERAFVLTVYGTDGRPVTGFQLSTRIRQTSLKLPLGSYTYDVHDTVGRPVQSGQLVIGSEPTTLEIR